MKTLIVFHSEHQGNTKKVSDAIGKAIGASALRSADAVLPDLEEYDLVGFGSGIYHGRFHDSLYRMIEDLPAQNGKKAFLFSTTGSKSYALRAHEAFKTLLKTKGFFVVGEFSCLGYDTAISSEGINRGKPDASDLKNAVTFARGLAEK